MPETLRERQNALTREAIMDSLAGLIGEDGVHDFSIREVAESAGVSHRTVYRHFASREALLEALARRVGEAMGGRGGVARPGGADELPEAIRTNYGLFEQLAPDVIAGVVLAMGARIDPPTRRRRTGWFREDLDEVIAHLPEPQAAAVVALLRLLGSSRLWFLLTRDLQLDTERAGAVAGWAARVLLDELRRGGGPAGDPDPET